MSLKWNRLGAIAYALAIKFLIKQIVCINLMFHVRIRDNGGDGSLCESNLYMAQGQDHTIRSSKINDNFHLLFLTILELGEVWTRHEITILFRWHHVTLDVVYPLTPKAKTISRLSFVLVHICSETIFFSFVQCFSVRPRRLNNAVVNILNIFFSTLFAQEKR